MSLRITWMPSPPTGRVSRGRATSGAGAASGSKGGPSSTMERVKTPCSRTSRTSITWSGASPPCPKRTTFERTSSSATWNGQAAPSGNACAAEKRRRASAAPATPPAEAGIRTSDAPSVTVPGREPPAGADERPMAGGRSEPSRDLRPGPGAVVVPRILAPRPCVWRRAAGAYNGGLFRAPDGHGQAVSFALGSGPRPRRPRRRVGLGGLSAAFGRGRPERPRRGPAARGEGRPHRPRLHAHRLPDLEPLRARAGPPARALRAPWRRLLARVPRWGRGRGRRPPPPARVRIRLPSPARSRARAGRAHGGDGDAGGGGVRGRGRRAADGLPRAHRRPRGGLRPHAERAHEPRPRAGPRHPRLGSHGTAPHDPGRGLLHLAVTRTSSRRIPRPRAAAVLLLAACVACARARSEDRVETAAVPEAVTFNRHIAPIVFRNCAPCHRPGEAGPFSLLSYADVRKRAEQIARVTSIRFMPPWPPEPGYGDLAGPRRLGDDQVALIQRWARAGAPEGPPPAPSPPAFTEGWQLGPPDLVIEMDRAYTVPAEGTDLFRNFVLPAPVKTTRYVR